MRRGRLAAAFFVLSITAAPLPTRAAPAVASVDASQGRQQVLVMLRLPPEHFHPGADYSDGYGDGQGHTARWRIASRLARAHGLTLVSDWPMPMVGVDCFIMQAPEGQSTAAAAAALSREPEVAWSEPSQIYHALGAAAPEHAKAAAAPYNDPLFPVQPAARHWRLADLHRLSTGRQVKVAVVDSRVEATHPDLAGQVILSENFVQDGSQVAEQHGTGVAGVIAARADNGVGIVGVAPGARLMALRACWQQPAVPGATPSTHCDSLSLARALQFAIAHDAQVINLSLSGPPDILLGKLLDVALARGATVVGAVDPDSPGGGFPATHAGVVAVADETLASPAAGVYIAPGRDVPTTQPGGRWFLVNGSSYAAAHVSGLAALTRERQPHAGHGVAFAPQPAGGGLVDACATLMRTPPQACGCDCAHVAEPAAPRRP